MAFSAARRVSASSSTRFRSRTAASTCVLSVRCRPRALSSPPSRAASRMRPSRPLPGPVLEQSAPELAQDAVVEAGVGQIERQQVLPADPATDRLGRLAVAQPLAELHERDQRQPPRGIGRLAEYGVEIGEVAILEHRAEAL